MKNFNLLFVLIVFCYKIQAQVDPLPGPSPLTPGIIDGVVLKEDIISQTKMEYSPVRESDITWSKRVFSRIDAREKMNHTLFFPYDNFIDVAKDEPWTPPKSLKDINDPNWYRNDKNWSLWTIILQNVMLGKLTVYNSEPNREMIAESGNKLIEDGYSFKYPIIPSKNSRNYFTDVKYRDNINKVFSSGSKSKRPYKPFPVVEIDLNGDIVGKEELRNYTKGPSGETFIQWKDRLINTGDTSTGIDVQFFEELKRILRDPKDGIKDSLEFVDVWDATENGSDLKNPPLTKFISSSCITAYNIKEDWYFDKNRSKLERRIIAIAPVGRYDADTTVDGYQGYLDRSATFIYVNNDGNFVNSANELIDMKTAKIVEKEIFWLYFDELRDVIVNYYVYNDKSDAQFDSFDDFFIQRRFSSTAYKTSDKFDREIEDYKFGVDRLYEAERIKEEIRKWEQDIWNY